MIPRSLLLVTGFTLSALGLHADVKMPALFGDHMVLQQDGKIPVWGTADPGEKVTVTVGTDTASGQADATGQWRVDLAAMPTNSTGQTMTVRGKNTLTFQDVLVGEVWLASGQSNMEFSLRGAVNAAEAQPQATNPQIRLFIVKHQPGIDLKHDVTGTWQVCTPDSAAGFSAVAYFFGQELQQKLNRPIGLIGSYWGGTPVQTWMSLETLTSIPDTAKAAAAVQKRRDAFPKDAAAQTAQMADYQAKLTDWQTTIDVPFQAVTKKWQKDTAAAKLAGQPLPPRPVESVNKPLSPDGEGGEPSALFNGMINPLIPYAIKGALWYQGESNAGGWGLGYDVLLSGMINDWRSRWAEGDFPFLVVGLANNGVPYPFPTDAGWAGIRGGQAKVTETVPNTALAEALDLGDGRSIHPVYKLQVGQRLAAAALHVAYGQDIPFAGPRFDSMTIEGNKARIKFKDVASGLAIAAPPVPSKIDPPVSTTELAGFAIAGADKKWVFAKAVIDGKDVVVSSDQVPNPVAVRYGWAQNPQVNFYNKDGFPAVPFRTDDWPPVAPSPQPAPGK